MYVWVHSWQRHVKVGWQVGWSYKNSPLEVVANHQACRSDYLDQACPRVLPYMVVTAAIAHHRPERGKHTDHTSGLCVILSVTTICLGVMQKWADLWLSRTRLLINPISRMLGAWWFATTSSGEFLYDQPTCLSCSCNRPGTCGNVFNNNTHLKCKKQNENKIFFCKMLAGIAMSQLKAVEHVYLSGVPGATGQPNDAYTYTGFYFIFSFCASKFVFSVQ